MDPALLHLVVTRLVDSPPADRAAEDLILTACEGAEALGAVLEGTASPVAVPPAPPPPPPPAAGVFLDSLTVEGFRGVGPAATLRLTPFPSLTLVVGRNGSGKSSFSEALELLLTRANSRWDGRRSDVWRKGWRNLHHRPTRVSADLIIEGRSGRLPIQRVWNDDEGLDDGVTTVAGASDDGTFMSLGWARSLSAYRPFLPHNELGALWDEGPTRLHDALASLLGLEGLTALIGTLSDARLRREQEARHVVAALGDVRSLLETVDDARARDALTATKGRTWDLAAVDAALAGGPAAGDRPADLRILGDLAAMRCPAIEAVSVLATRLRDVATRLVATAGTDAGRARATAQLLEAALTHVARHDQPDCPVCGAAGTTGPAWRAATGAEVVRLRALAADADRVHREAEAERGHALTLLGTVPAALHRAAEVGIDTTPLVGAWRLWLAVEPRAGLDELADHLEAAHPALEKATNAVRAAADAELRRREDVWRPCAEALAAWLASARPVVAGAPSLRSLKAAEAWVKDAEKQLRAARFNPIGAAVQRNWATLRQDSSVELGDLRLEGGAKSPSRRIALDVIIDGESGQALGVMSQGELNALALSLFLPRASLPESPFRFIVIDDPVQAMDPNKVDGLARVLEQASATHQVIVFTHDERLAAAVRRLDIDARVVEVNRREGSVVELRESLDPVRRHIDDAFAVANSDDVPDIAARVVPTFCRLALEAACSEVVMRRRLGRGERLSEVENLLGAASKLTSFFALALFDDLGRGADVFTSVSNRWGEAAASTFTRCNKGAHREDGGDLRTLCRAAEKLADQVGSLR